MEPPTDMSLRDSNSTSMDPPATSLFAPPTSPTYTLKQFLAYQPRLVTPPFGVSTEALSAEVSSPILTSTAGKRVEILDRLYPFSYHVIDNFRARIDTMDSSISFEQPLAPPHYPSPIPSVECIPGWIDAQILAASWQAVLRMLPDQRDYDLQVVKQVPRVVSSPRLIKLIRHE